MADTKSIPVRLESQLIARLDNIATQIGSSRSAVMRMLIQSWVEQFEKDSSSTLPVNWEEVMRGLDGRSNPAKPARPYLSLSRFPTAEVAESAGWDLPFYGQIAAGSPAVSDYYQDETKTVPKNFGNRPHYLLQVRGESMAPDYPDGSYVVIRPIDGEYATKNSVVVADDGSGPTLKKLEYRKVKSPDGSLQKPTPHLVSINPDYDDVIPASDTPIQGVVVDQYPADFFG